MELKEKTTILSIDVEDWYHLRHRHTTNRELEIQPAVIEQTERWLSWMEKRGIKATFFVLGLVAEKFPDLVRKIQGLGHEIASHGYAHHLTKNLSEKEFKNDIERSLEVLENITHEKVLGYRAPQFSIQHKDFSPLRILANLGLRYDSSIFPIRIRDYGWPGFPTGATKIKWDDGKEILEFPLSIWNAGGLSIPVAGGGYFRVLPQSVLKTAFRHTLANPLMLYFHPYEVSEPALRLSAMGIQTSFWKRLRMELPQNIGRGGRLLHKLLRVAEGHRFRMCREVCNEIEFKSHTIGSTTSSQGRRALL